MLFDTARAAITRALTSIYDISDLEPQLSHPEPQFGDVATNVAYQLAGQLKKSPQEIAAALAGAISDPSIHAVEAVGGYINLRLSKAFWAEQLKQIDSKYGSSQIGGGIKTEVEYISANPTGPTTIGNARGGFIGDTLANVLQSQGYAVTREYYFNNAGTQITKLLESVKASAGLVQVDDDKLQYRGDYIESLATEFKHDLETKSDDELKQLITQTILKRWIEPAIAKMGIRFGSWFNEQDLMKDGRFEATLDKLRKEGLVFERDGAIWLDTGKLGVKREERVVVKSSGDPTYLGPDLSFHDDLFGRRGFDLSIKVLGADHVDQFPSVKAAVELLHPGKRLEIAPHQWFHLIKDGKEVKISKRLGQFVTVESLIDEVGPAAARFLTLMRSAESSMDFDLNLAKERTQKNPVYYVMYAYARANSILAQAATRGLAPLSSIETLTDPEVALIRQMSRFPPLLQEIASDYAVHRLTFFGIETAKLFHDLYESERIIDLDKAVASRRLFIIQQFVVFMRVYFQVFGIEPVERMEASTEWNSKD